MKNNIIYLLAILLFTMCKQVEEHKCLPPTPPKPKVKRVIVMSKKIRVGEILYWKDYRVDLCFGKYIHEDEYGNTTTNLMCIPCENLKKIGIY